MHSLALVEHLIEDLHLIEKEVYGGPAPAAFYHYTKLDRVESIVNTRALWATCVTDQADQSEFHHGIELVQEAVEKTLREGVSDFTANVLQRLKVALLSRRELLFIACFCGEDNSNFHWNEHGEYCLTFPMFQNGTIGLRCADRAAESWYQRVIYDADLQATTMNRAVRSTIDSISKYTDGTPVGPCIDWMAQDCARNAAQLLLRMAIGLKKPEFEHEKEWRLVFCPNFALNNSAPSMADDNFNVTSKTNVQRHLVLQAHSDLEFLHLGRLCTSSATLL